VIFYGRAFIRRWMGPGYDNAYWISVIMSASVIIDLPQSPGIQLLYGLSKHKVYAVLNIWEGVANVALSILFLRWWGVYGVALGTLAEMAFFKLLIQPVYICRAAGLPVRAYLGEAILVTLLKTAAPLALYFLLIGRLVTPSYGSLALAVAAQTVLFAPGAYYFILGEPERDVIARAVRGLFPRVAVAPS
jgi:O-antigen/teichoic acid export membrane protein